YALTVVARIVCEPLPTEIGLEPAGEVTRSIRRESPHVAKISGAIASRNVHAAAERNSEVSVVTADALAFVEGLPGRHGRASVLIAKGDVMMDEIADGLDSRPAGLCLIEQAPHDFIRPDVFAIAAA